MERRTAGALIGILVVVCAGLGVAVAYPFTTSDPHAAAPPSEQFTVGDGAAYTATGRIVVDGDVRLAFDGVVTADGAWYQRVEEPNVTSEAYRAGPTEPVYQRLTITGQDRAERRRERIREDEDSRLHRERRDGGRVTFVVERPADSDTEPVSGTASVFVTSLSVVSYRTTASGSPGSTVHEPRSGWYDGRRTYRITGASGEVDADAETHAVRSANVSWELTDPAGTYAEYVLTSGTSDDPTTHRVMIEFDRGETDVERPSWVEEPG